MEDVKKKDDHSNQDEFETLFEKALNLYINGDDKAGEEAFDTFIEAFERQNAPSDEVKAQARLFEAKAEWDLAEKAHLTYLEMMRGEENPGFEAHAHLSLSEFFQLRGNTDKAWQAAEAAVACARQQSMSLVTGLMVKNLAGCALTRRDPKAGLTAIHEILSSVIESPTLHAGLLAMQAKCLIELDRWEEAGKSLSDALAQMLKESIQCGGAGIIAVQTTCLEIEARLLAQDGKRENAIQNLQQVVANRRQLASFEHLEPIYMQHKLADALNNLGNACAQWDRQEEACQYQQESEAIRQKIEKGSFGDDEPSH